MNNKLNPNLEIPCKYYIFLILLVLTIIFIWFMYLTKGNFTSTEENIKAAQNDPMNNTFFTVLGEPINGWSISHSMYYTVAGFLFPQCWKIMAITGISWEAFETLMGSLYTDTDLVNKNKTDSAYDVFWAGRPSDLIMNTIGYFVGYFLRLFVEQYILKV